jgi:hypothetical protein
MENKGQHRLRITKGCMVAGQACAEGDLIEADDEVAYDALNAGVAKFEDGETPEHLRQRQRYGFIDRESDEKPKIRLVKTA